MQKIRLISRQPGMYDYNIMATTINEIIDKLEKKKNIIQYHIEKEIKDFWFFKGNETKLPYKKEYTVNTYEDLENIKAIYAFSLKEMKELNELLKDNSILLTLNIFWTFNDKKTEKEKKQEIALKTIDSGIINHPEEKTSLKWKKTTKQPRVSQTKKKKK